MEPIETNYTELFSIFLAAKRFFRSIGETEKVERISEMCKAITENDAYEMVIIEKPF